MLSRSVRSPWWPAHHRSSSTSQRTAHKLSIGDFVAARQLISVAGNTLDLPDSGRLVHLQFRRFAGCPVCNLHLGSLQRRAADICSAGIREIIVFHSSADTLRPHVSDFPFDFVADPRKELYVEFGVESAPRALLDARVWAPIALGIFRSLVYVLWHHKPVPSATPEGGRLGLPADFLIAPNGRVLASKYGLHAYDQWSVDELLQLARLPE